MYVHEDTGLAAKVRVAFAHDVAQLWNLRQVPLRDNRTTALAYPWRFCTAHIESFVLTLF